MQRVVIIGTTGAGRTALARALATKLGAAHIELDALYWQQNWTPAAAFASQVEHALRAECWVVDGNYSRVRPYILSCADTVIWLDYSFGTKLWRLFRRTSRRTLTRAKSSGAAIRRRSGHSFSAATRSSSGSLKRPEPNGAG